jgi:hypothetical protein
LFHIKKIWPRRIQRHPERLSDSACAANRISKLFGHGNFCKKRRTPADLATGKMSSPNPLMKSDFLGLKNNVGFSYAYFKQSASAECFFQAASALFSVIYNYFVDDKRTGTYTAQINSL